VAKVLWNLMAGSGNYGMPAIWSVVTSSAYTSLPDPNYTPNQITLETFWDVWIAGNDPSTAQAIFSERKIDYHSDLYEGDGSPNVARKYVPNTPEVHTLYPSADADYVAFNATASNSYTITTSNLRNGADTIIQVLAPDQNPIAGATNDNANGKTYSGTVVPSDILPSLCDTYQVCHENGSDVLGSHISFTPPSSGTYFVKITTSPSRPISAGKYGTYTLTITP
jgi:hypothetical protein